MRYLKLILLSILVQACGSSVPLTEIYVFNHEPGTSPKDSLSFTRAGGFSAFPNNFYRSKFDNLIITEKDGTPINSPSAIPVGFNYSHAANFQHYAIGYNIGVNTLGVNTTIRVIGRNYLTINASVFNGVESVLQRPITLYSFPFLDNGKYEFNATLGLYSKAYNLRYRTFTLHDLDGLDKDENLFHSDFIYHWGIRSFFQFRNRNENLFTAGFISTGYAPVMDDFILNFGITVGFIRF